LNQVWLAANSWNQNREMVEPMDIDPIDDGPPIVGSWNYNTTSPLPLTMDTGPLDDPKLAIDMLRSDDISNRVAAAYKLDFIAKALGQQRTRDVRAHTKNYDAFLLL
jgi:hypothetical protein